MTKETLTEILENADFVFAKTMPKTPHFYTLRKNWNDDLFCQVVLKIREIGIPEKFAGREYIYFYANGNKYWTMGAPLNKDGRPYTILINRAVTKYENRYDLFAEKYDDLFDSEENAELLKLLNLKEDESVLDIGCGTGLILDLLNIKDYVGVDASNKMTKIAQKKHPAKEIINVPFSDFYKNRKFDCVIALFGAGSYLTDEEESKINDYVKPGGRTFIMYYKPEYYPKTYIKTGINLEKPQKNREGKNFGGFIIIENKGANKND